eukprot:1076189-Rhodomonas_salina.1
MVTVADAYRGPGSLTIATEKENWPIVSMLVSIRSVGALMSRAAEDASKHGRYCCGPSAATESEDTAMISSEAPHVTVLSLPAIRANSCGNMQVTCTACTPMLLAFARMERTACACAWSSRQAERSVTLPSLVPYPAATTKIRPSCQGTVNTRTARQSLAVSWLARCMRCAESILLW